MEKGNKEKVEKHRKGKINITTLNTFKGNYSRCQYF